jgi:hypothetical protein
VTDNAFFGVVREGFKNSDSGKHRGKQKKLGRITFRVQKKEIQENSCHG